MKNKRAQAAMEFLMTYGWAILVVLVVIGALAYFGVLDPSRFMPERCQFPIGLDCGDVLARETGSLFSLQMLNSMGYGIIITEIEVEDAAGSKYDVFSDTGAAGSDCAASFDDSTDDDICNTQGGTAVGGECDWNGLTGWRLLNGEEGVFTINCTNAYQGAGTITQISNSGKVKADVTVTYFKDDSTLAFAHTTVGEVFLEVES